VDTRFVKLNDGSNAEPNAPVPVVARLGNDVVLEFRFNPFQFDKFSNGDRARLGRCKFSGKSSRIVAQMASNQDRPINQPAISRLVRRVSRADFRRTGVV
jgi:hypothetical protein